MYYRARKKTEKRHERDGTTQRRLRESRWTASRARRLSRHYLDRAIKCRQRRVHRSHDSRINGSDVPWRNAFRTAANAIVPRSYRRIFDGAARARDAYRANSIYRCLYIGAVIQLEHPTDVSHTCVPRGRVVSDPLGDFPRSMIGCTANLDALIKRATYRNSICSRNAECRVSRRRSKSRAKLEKSPGLVDDGGSCYERCESQVTGAQSSATAPRRKKIAILRLLLRSKKRQKRRRESATSETRPAIKEQQVKQGQQRCKLQT